MGSAWLCYQVLRAFSHIHAKGLLHRDISPTNILVKEYEHLVVAKVSDFGLVHLPDSNLTTCHMEFKGYFNDPGLRLEGFDNYNIQHETYALTRLIFYIMTGERMPTEFRREPWRRFCRRGFIQTGMNGSRMWESFNKLWKFFKGYRVLFSSVFCLFLPPGMIKEVRGESREGGPAIFLNLVSWRKDRERILSW